MSATINRTDRGEAINESSWPKHTVNSVETRKRDVVIRFTNWLLDKDEPAFDVEVYNKGIYDWNESKSFCLSSGLTRHEARQEAIEFACLQLRKFGEAV